jgi:hypothetical protein
MRLKPLWRRHAHSKKQHAGDRKARRASNCQSACGSPERSIRVTAYRFPTIFFDLLDTSELETGEPTCFALRRMLDRTLWATCASKWKHSP